MCRSVRLDELGARELSRSGERRCMHSKQRSLPLLSGPARQAGPFRGQLRHPAIESVRPKIAVAPMINDNMRMSVRGIFFPNPFRFHPGYDEGALGQGGVQGEIRFDASQGEHEGRGIIAYCQFAQRGLNAPELRAQFTQLGFDFGPPFRGRSCRRVRASKAAIQAAAPSGRPVDAARRRAVAASLSSLPRRCP